MKVESGKMVSVLMLLIIGISFHVHAQNDTNLVYNPSFEEHRFCPQRIDALGVMKAPDAWWQPTRGSSDYFNACSGRECLVPRNKMGYQEAHSGEAYCGIYCSQEDYREYLQTELRSPLQSGLRYRVSFFVSLADKSPNAVAAIGALLTADRVSDSTMGILMRREWVDREQSIATRLEPQVANAIDSVLADTKQWVEVSGVFIAEGGERFLTIGNFADFNHSNVIDIQNIGALLQGAYYYIDDVSVVCLDTDRVEPPQPPAAPAVGDVVTMWGIYFDVDSYELLQQSYKELTKLLALMQDNPGMKIELRGHTDNTGTVEGNRRLSENRAKAVMDYLVERGIDNKRLTSNGYGESLPIDSNDTPEGRRHNRRVEYRVVEM